MRRVKINWQSFDLSDQKQISCSLQEKKSSSIGRESKWQKRTWKIGNGQETLMSHEKNEIINIKSASRTKERTHGEETKMNQEEAEKMTERLCREQFG